jgi:hypothetical protein
VELAGESISQDRLDPTVSWSLRRQKPQRGKRSLRRHVASRVLESFAGQGELGLAPGSSKVRGVGTPPRGGAGRSRRGSESDDGPRSAGLPCWWRFTRFRGHCPWSREPNPSGGGTCRAASAVRRVRVTEAREEKASEGREAQESIGRWLSGDRGLARTDSREEKASQRTKAVTQAGHGAHGPG